ncbi:hypothetical protein [Natronorubrum thiooxidans]|uniref:Uncharacterized protein n=1 Tax=Natronorubrum thiooxidans TaxID=308853 RepID=A0A1N7F9B0_9EURY|nr:hypothetical protein [Natronorubrum thiooxidans]SIR96941.1 hypothetical protein SAMN05421752_106104 [Natronorubrum thiooxidans]
MGSTMVTRSEWLHGFWAYYRRYTDTTVHTASTAALAIFGLLVFVDPWFVAVAIGCYVLPPVVLYTLSDESASDAGEGDVPEESPSTHADRTVDPVTTESETGGSSGTDVLGPTMDRPTGDGDTDSDSDGGDADFDGVGTDTDADADGTDTDFDRDDGDTDSDSDDGDTDSDTDG